MRAEDIANVFERILKDVPQVDTLTAASLTAKALGVSMLEVGFAVVWKRISQLL